MYSVTGSTVDVFNKEMAPFSTAVINEGLVTFQAESYLTWHLYKLLSKSNEEIAS